ncbi:C40 family peptidase [Lentzea sp. NEAU-D7]|uniref:C40 family peptidase n=1 Tax=Lentzea sp. NEAU-D7 TaxID=2994667 RepID=UPI00224A9C52|nr:NlpC/P60 family protein [Lentzea sp. NEAU-D7]MCX2953996.1 NlpC/P60 family protein [Lentzea sp. NEAU-D7]
MKHKGMLTGAAVAVVALVAGAVVFWPRDTMAPATPATEQTTAQAGPELTFERVGGPKRTVVRDRAGGVVATFTDEARTALINGSPRSFSEPKATAATVNTSAWVRLLPQPWAEGGEKASWFAEWFRTARQDTTPDVLEIATQYAVDAPAEKDAAGVRFRGDASFGPVKASGAGRQEQSDFYDYLGVPWPFPNGPAGKPDRARYGAVDCSGYVRLVFGYRLGMPLLNTNTAGPGLPRRAFAISEFGPGVQLVRNELRRATSYSALQPGDLVFFEVEDDPETLDHVGIYLGIDNRGKHRFISSRERMNGPTMGDVGGTSLLDDGGTYSTAWRSARRL